LRKRIYEESRINRCGEEGAIYRSEKLLPKEHEIKEAANLVGIPTVITVTIVEVKILTDFFSEDFREMSI